MPPPLLAIIGPTASGKESVALHVAPGLSAEILLLDSMKLYRGMHIGTASPSTAARSRVPHHLCDLAEPEDGFSTRRWLEAAEAAVTEVRARGRLPLFSGGTALYLKALLYGLFEGPDADPEIRARWKACGPAERHARLQEVDPTTAEKVHPNDERRVVRALEIFELTGRPPSELRREWEALAPARPAVLAGIRRDRQELYARIDARVDRMIEAGLVEEVRALLPRLGPVARQALGYKEVADYLTGALPDLEEAVRVLKSRTRTFARRQLTWFKHFDVRWVDAAPGEPAEDIAPRVLAALSR